MASRNRKKIPSKENEKEMTLSFEENVIRKPGMVTWQHSVTGGVKMEAAERRRKRMKKRNHYGWRRINI